MGRKSPNIEFQEFKALLERVNNLPKSAAEAEEFYSYMDPVLRDFQAKAKSLGFLDPPPDEKIVSDSHRNEQIDCLKRLENAFRLRVEKTNLRSDQVFPIRFRVLAKLIGPVSPDEMRQTIEHWKFERELLEKLINAATDRRRGGSGFAKIDRTSWVFIDQSFRVREIILDPLSLICSKNLSIARLAICPVCRNVFWKKIDRQVTRKQVTCGERPCATKHSNLKRSRKEN